MSRRGMRLHLAAAFVPVLGVEPGNAALRPDMHGRLDDRGIVERHDVDAEPMLAVAAENQLGSAIAAEFAHRLGGRAINLGLTLGVAEVILGNRRERAHRSAESQLADPAVTIGAPLDRTVDAVAQTAAMASAFKRHVQISTSHHTGTWSDGLSRPRTCLSMAQRLR